MVELATKWWCRTFHEKLMRPVRGHYRCAECLREWPVSWEISNATSTGENRSDFGRLTLTVIEEQT